MQRDAQEIAKCGERSSNSRPSRFLQDDDAGLLACGFGNSLADDACYAGSPPRRFRPSSSVLILSAVFFRFPIRAVCSAALEWSALVASRRANTRSSVVIVAVLIMILSQISETDIYLRMSSSRRLARSGQFLLRS